jgi:Ni/Co efflux regulator RcnB
MTILPVALLAVTCGAAVAQGNGHDRNRGQAKKEQRAESRRPAPDQHQSPNRINDHDRQVANTWYGRHRSHPPRGFRDRDRLPQAYEARLQPGYEFDSYMRRRAYLAPRDLTRDFAPAPRGYRYMVIGGHIVLVDAGYRVADVFRLTINIGN